MGMVEFGIEWLLLFWGYFSLCILSTLGWRRLYIHGNIWNLIPFPLWIFHRPHMNGRSLLSQSKSSSKWLWEDQNVVLSWTWCVPQVSKLLEKIRFFFFFSSSWLCDVCFCLFGINLVQNQTYPPYIPIYYWYGIY